MTRNGTNTSAPKGVHARVTDVVRAHTLHAAEQLDVHAHLEGELGIDSVLFGGSGVMQGRIGRYLRDAIPGRVFSGTSEIQRNNIIARTLGLGG